MGPAKTTIATVMNSDETNASETHHAETRPFDLRALLLALFVSALWGTGYPVSQAAMKDCSPCLFAALRFSLAAILLLPFLPSLPRKLKALNATEGKALIVISLFFAANFALVLWGVRVEGANQTAVLMNLIVLWTVIFAHLLLPDDKIDKSKLMGLLFGLLGAVVVTSGKGALGRWSVGNIFPFLATICISLQNVLIRKYLSRLDPFTILHCEVIVAVPLLGILAHTFEGTSVIWSSIFLFGLTYTGLMTTCVAFFIWYHLLTTYPVSSVAIMTFSIPVFAMAGSYVAHGTIPTLEQLCGSLLIAFAIFATNRVK